LIFFNKYLKFRLKYVQDGYYKCVSEFTPKPLLKQIDSLLNIETNIGRGRAWLFFALNDNLTESYIKCFQDNKKLVKKNYTSDSIVNDNQVRIYLLRNSRFNSFVLEINRSYNFMFWFGKYSIRFKICMKEKKI
jgi:hypothetical protein